MPVASIELPYALRSIAEALLIGLLIGMQREGIQQSAVWRRAGVRDFVLIAISGGICGLLQISWLSAAALLAITILVATFSFRVADTDAGVTTELATVVTFCLGFMTAYPAFPAGSLLAIGTTIAVVFLLEAKHNLHKLIREGITEVEFNSTLRFLALIFIIYPVLPEGAFGPYGFFSPRLVWLFVILVSSISYAGYFLEKFLGAGRGLPLAGILGGLASTTAATASFAKAAAESPRRLRSYWHATLLANSVQFPRLLVLLFVVNPQLAYACLAPLLAMTAAGLLFAWLIYRGTEQDPGYRMAVGNPFRLRPALKFGAMFAAVVLFSKVAAAKLGGAGVLLTSVLGGSVDVDAVSVAVSGLLRDNALVLQQGVWAVLVAVFANAVLKIALAGSGGGVAFAKRTAAGFAVMFAAGIVVAVAQ